MIAQLGSFDLSQVARWALLGVVAAVLSLATAVLARRFSAKTWQRRKERLIQQSRPVLLRVLADDSVDPESMATLATLPDRVWRACEPSVVAMLGKVRGASHEALVGVLVERDTLRRAVKAASSRSPVRRCRAVEMLGAMRHRPSLPLIAALLQDGSAEVRQVAARAMGRIGAASSARSLLEASAGPRRLTPRDVASALVLLEAGATEDIIAVVAESREPGVRVVGVEVLGLRGAVDSAALLVEMLDHDPDYEVRITVARALGRLGVPDSLQALAKALESESGEMRAVAARALGQLGSANSVAKLVGCLGDPAHRVASNAAESLAALGESGLEALRMAATSCGARETGYAREALAVHAVGRRTLGRAGA